CTSPRCLAGRRRLSSRSASSSAGVLKVPRVRRLLVPKVLALRKVLAAPKVRRSLATGAVTLAAAAVWIRCAPVPAELLAGVDTPSTVVVDRQGRVLYEALGSGGSRVKPLDADHLPPVLVAATLAAEDRRFYSHIGVDPISLARAARHNLVEG